MIKIFHVTTLFDILLIDCLSKLSVNAYGSTELLFLSYFKSDKKINSWKKRRPKPLDEPDEENLFSRKRKIKKNFIKFEKVLARN